MAQEERTLTFKEVLIEMERRDPSLKGISNKVYHNDLSSVLELVKDLPCGKNESKQIDDINDTQAV